ncbi:MAG: site-specific DNA-methyltransferase, partial [Planctomycetes bacterium]|nr:site-specific DNA-methyltransferase [Planctomycetota bacterium]
MVTLYAGDALDSLRQMPSDSVHVCVTSPPYWGLRSYLPKGHERKPLELGQEPTPDAYVAKMVELFREVRRVLHDSGTLWLNLGDSYASSGQSGETRVPGVSGLNMGGPTAKMALHNSGRAPTPPGLKP